MAGLPPREPTCAACPRGAAPCLDSPVCRHFSPVVATPVSSCRLQLDGDAVNTSAFCMAHPDAGTHRDVARQLAEFIDSVLPEFGRAAQQQP